MKAVRVLGFFRTIQMKLIIIYVLLILFAMQLIGIYFIQAMKSSTLQNFSDNLHGSAILIATTANLSGTSPEPRPGETAPTAQTADGKKDNTALNDYVSNWAKMTNADIQIVDANGVVMSTSEDNAQRIVNQKNTQYVVGRALQNIKGKDNERNLIDADGKRKKVIAEPILSGGKVIGAVYIMASMEGIYSQINRVNGIFLSGTLIALALTAVLGVILSHTITSPVKEITRQVTYVAEGHFDRRVRILSQDEIGQLSNAFNNMTDRLSEALSANEEEKEKLASILINMSDGVIASDDQGKIILINRRAEHMLHLQDEEAVGRPLFEILRIAPEMVDIYMHPEEIAALIDIQREGESERKVRVTFTPIHRRDNGISGTIVVLQDVTDQEELEQARREFVANVSHELRTPLTTIKSYLEALEDGALEEQQLAQRFVGVARGETERMIRLVSDLLNLSRFDNKQALMSKDWTDVTEMLEEVADRFSFQLEQRRIQIQIGIGSGIQPVLLDRDKIDQVLDNLVSNAIKYTGDGGKIEMSAHLKEQELEIAVLDNGIGIPKKDLSRIFDRFYRVDKARSRNMGGTGLGLSIAREIIKAHGGTIQLESEYNKGTKVTFILPCAPEGSEPA